MFKNILLSTAIGAVLASQAYAQNAAYIPGEIAHSAQLGLIGVTDALQNDAHNGAGIKFANIDTGVNVKQIDFQNRVAQTACTIAGPSCAALAAADDNGHGTFTMSEMIAGKGNAGIVGVAPSGTGIAIKVLAANGSGWVADVAAGIRAAADKGANIINLSLTFGGTAAETAAINYAASKNAYIVYAGGNSNAAFMGNATVSGLTDAAIARILILGSTNAAKVKSSFSNTAGTGGFMSTTGKFTAFKSIWVDADGENIIGASNYSDKAVGAAYYTTMSGTSMAAPQGAGVAGLLAARWPFLLKTGQISTILVGSAQDLGAAGVDSIYGAGFLRADTAFKPVGSLMAAGAGGKMTPIVGATIATAGPTGSMPAVTSALSKATVYDSLNRDYAVSLAPAVVAKTTTGVATAAATAAAASTAKKFAELADGGYLAMNFASAGGAVNPLGDGWKSQALIGNPSTSSKDQWSFAMSQGGTYVGAGQNGGASMSFGEARWTGKSAFWGTDTETAGALLGLTSGGNYATTGFSLAKGSRFTVSTTSSADDQLAQLGTTATSHGIALGYTFQPTRSADWEVSLTGSALKENGMLLGSPGAGALGFGASSSVSAGLATNFNFGHGLQLGLDATVAGTKAGAGQNSMFSGTSTLSSMGFGAALAKNAVFGQEDAAGITVKKPLRVYGGSAKLDMGAGTDGDGHPIIERINASLAPSGNETDLGVSYNAPLGHGLQAGLNLTYRNDADNIAGAKDLGAMARLSLRF